MDAPTAEPQRFYGVDVTDEAETIAEAWVDEDGVIHLTAVTLDRTPSHEAATG